MSWLNHAKKHSLNLSQNLKFKFIFIDSLLAKSLCHVVELNLLLPDKKKKTLLFPEFNYTSVKNKKNKLIASNTVL